MSNPDRDYWFAAKRYGWGWGLPSRWQGWAAFVGYLAALLLGVYLIQERRNPVAPFIYMAITTGIFVAVVVWKGEPPWGRDKK